MDVWLHFYKIQEQAELSYGDRDQNSVYLWGILTRRRNKGPSGELAVFCVLIWRVNAQVSTRMWGGLGKLYSKNWRTLLNVSCISKRQDKHKKEMIK